MAVERLRPDADADFAARLKNDRLTRMIAERLFDLENRVRALEGKQPISRAAARSALRKAFKGQKP